MRPPFVMAMAALAVWASAAHAQTFMVESGRYVDFRQLQSRDAPAARTTIAVTLRLPDQRVDRYPAAVVVHTLAGYQEANEGWHADELRKAGFATLTYSSDAARRLRQGDAVGAWPSAVAESYAALALLAADPRIDADRIAIVGFSFGGEVAHLSALERLRAASLPGGRRFAAHVGYYPAGIYGAMAEPGAYTGAPILMLLGEKDDNLPVAKVRGYLDYARAAGFASPIQTSVYRGAYHAWTVPSLGAPHFYPQYRSMRKCPYLLLGAWPPSVLADDQARPIVQAEMEACGKAGQGYTMAYDEAARARSTREAMAFLLKTLQ